MQYNSADMEDKMPKNKIIFRSSWIQFLSMEN